MYSNVNGLGTTPISGPSEIVARTGVYLNSGLGTSTIFEPEAQNQPVRSSLEPRVYKTKL